MSDPIQQFRAGLSGRNIIPPTDLLTDGVIHRCDAEGKGGKGDASYLLHMDALPAGGFENHRDGLGWENWRADIGRTMTPAEEAASRAKIETARREREAEEAKRQQEAHEKACLLWAEAYPNASHAYLTRKGIAAHGVKVLSANKVKAVAPNLSPELTGALLVIPMRDTAGIIQSLQFITEEGIKRPLTGGRKRGCYFSIGEPNGVMCLAEGFATGASIHEATGHAVTVAFDAGNLLLVAKALREKSPDLLLVLCADDDYRTDGNPGLTKAREAAQAVGGRVAVPDFGDHRPEGATDFNDLHQAQGLGVVARCINGAIQAPQTTQEATQSFDNPTDYLRPKKESASTGRPEATAKSAPVPQLSLDVTDSTGWLVPQRLSAKIAPEPYPLDALPKSVREAVEEVQGFVKAPMVMVASSALAALSLAIQTHVDAKRAEQLHGPTSLFLLTIADSGERKSTCDNFFTLPIRNYEEAQAEAAKPLLKDYAAAIEAWEAKRGGVKEKIRQLAKDNKPTAGIESALRDLEHDKPEPPRIPRLLYADTTPEALAYGLAKHWPSGGIVSAEGGSVFGSHGMAKDSAMRNMSLLNQLWDGARLSIDRKTSESFTVQGARLTIALQVQEPTLREFLIRSGELARGTGFLARFLIAWPESTQGQRPFTEAPANWPQLALFHQHITEILDQPAPIDEEGALTPLMLEFTPEAKTAWVEYNNAIESELPSGGELHKVRDVASKSADNAARLAALFHVFSGDAGAISFEAFEDASRIVAWHLSEARRFFGELALPPELADAARLDTWLIAYGKREKTHFVGKNHVRQHGPIREGTRLDAAIRELAELDRLRLVKDGKRLTIQVNPALVIEGAHRDPY